MMPYRMLLSAVALALGLAGLPAHAADAGQANPGLAAKFASPDQTIEYHFMLKAPAFSDAGINETLAGVLDSLKLIGEAEKLKGPREGAYLDTRDRVLDKAHLIVRLRNGLFTVKARSTDLASLTDLQPCTRIKYEQDFFDEVGYSISSEVVFKKEEWLEDPTKASVKDVMAFLQAKCPALGNQLEPILKPLQSLVAPGVARMYSAEFKLNHPLAARLKEANVAAWLFPGSPHTLVEVAWTGLVSDKAALDRMYYEAREKLMNAGVLAPDQSSKTEQYFKAFYGATALDTDGDRMLYRWAEARIIGK